MSKEEFDNSVFEDVRQELEILVGNCEQVSLVETNPVLDSVLYLCDIEWVQKLKVLEERLKMEYGYDDALMKLYGINTLMKFINRDSPTHYYKLYEKETWEQVNDQDKVRQRLDAKLIKWQNAMEKRTVEKLKAKGIDGATIDKIKHDMKQEVKEAYKELDFIKANFDTLDVRISDYTNRKSYTAVTIAVCNDKGDCLIKKKDSFTRVTLRKDIPNVLWYKPKSEDEKLTELQRFFKGATNAFGSIYYKEH
jgi:hypothetical protein